MPEQLQLIYIWNQPIYSYNSYNPFSYEVQTIAPTGATTNLSVPAESEIAAFSSEGQFIAYTAKSGDKPLEIWISDINLCQPKMFYLDQEGWITEHPSENYSGEFLWGPGNKTVIFRSIVKEKHLIVINVETGKTYFWQGLCNEIVQLNDLLEYSLGCPLDNSYAIIKWDGSVTFLPTPPKVFRESVIDWSFSPSGGTVAYIDINFDIFIRNRVGEIAKLPIAWGNKLEKSFYQFSHQNSLHWSKDGDMLLAFGLDAINTYCPYTKNETSEIEKQPCWILFDSRSNQVTWSLPRNLVEELGLDWENIRVGESAALSPDSGYVLVQILSEIGNYFTVFSLSTNEMISNNSFYGYRLVWPFQ